MYHYCLDVPAALNTGVTLLSSSDFQTCASSKSSFSCWGKYGATQPAEFESGVLALAVGPNHTCASTATSFQCWDNAKKQINVPEELKNGVDSVTVGKSFTCALKLENNLRNLVCFADLTKESIGSIPKTN